MMVVTLSSPVTGPEQIDPSSFRHRAHLRAIFAETFDVSRLERSTRVPQAAVSALKMACSGGCATARFSRIVRRAAKNACPGQVLVDG